MAAISDWTETVTNSSRRVSSVLFSCVMLGSCRVATSSRRHLSVTLGLSGSMLWSLGSSCPAAGLSAGDAAEAGGAIPAALAADSWFSSTICSSSSSSILDLIS